jgi:plastocyanin
VTFKRTSIIAALVAVAAFALTAPVPALAETVEHTLVIQNHRFEPEELRVKAGVKIKLTVMNQDPTPEEFESFELNREKIIPGNGKGFVFIGPLKAGTYPFFGDFNQATAQGRIVAED